MKISRRLSAEEKNEDLKPIDLADFGEANGTKISTNLSVKIEDTMNRIQDSVQEAIANIPKTKAINKRSVEEPIGKISLFVGIL